MCSGMRENVSLSAMRFSLGAESHPRLLTETSLTITILLSKVGSVLVEMPSYGETQTCPLSGGSALQSYQEYKEVKSCFCH